MADAPPKYEFAKLELKAGDILAIKVNCAPVDFTHSLVESLRKAAEPRLPEGVKVLVLGPRVDLMTITRERAPAFFEGQATIEPPPPKPAKSKAKGKTDG